MAVYKRTWTNKRGVQHAWVADYFSKDPETGKLIRERPTFGTKTEAQAHWLEHHPRGTRGRANAKTRRTTIKQAAKIWLEAVELGRNGRDPAEASTLRQYTGHVKHIVQGFDPDDKHIPASHRIEGYFDPNEKLSELTAPAVTDFRDWLLKNLSRPMAKKVLSSFKSIIREAESRGLIHANPASSITIAGKGRHKEPIVIPEKADVAAVLQRLDKWSGKPPKDGDAKQWRKRRAVVYTAALSGLRESELRGVSWPQFSRKGGTIKVTRKADEKGNIGSPKSATSRRTVDIPPALVAVLANWQVECPKGDLVFPTTEGTVESMGNINRRMWRPLLKSLGMMKPKKDTKTGKIVRDEDGEPVLIPRFRFHDLRHFFASMMIADGANPKEVQVAMGHSSIQITLDLYGHLFQDDDAQAGRKARAARLASVLGVS